MARLVLQLLLLALPILQRVQCRTNEQIVQSTLRLKVNTNAKETTGKQKTMATSGSTGKTTVTKAMGGRNNDKPKAGKLLAEPIKNKSSSIPKSVFADKGRGEMGMGMGTTNGMGMGMGGGGGKGGGGMNMVRPTPAPSASFSPSPTFTFSPAPTATFSPAPTVSLSPAPSFSFSPEPTFGLTPQPVVTTGMGMGMAMDRGMGSMTMGSGMGRGKGGGMRSMGAPSRPSPTAGPTPTAIPLPESESPVANGTEAPTPSTLETVGPTPTAIPASLIPSTVGPTVIALPTSTRCAPTVGPCLNTASDAVTAFAALTDSATVAFCGGTSPLVLAAALTVQAADATICCASVTSTCVLEASGSDRVLVVNADAVTLQDLTIMGGTSDANGGNVIITGSGTHRIINTTISGGQAGGDGGNVYVETDATVRVEGSSIVDGTAVGNGGGLAIVGAGAVEIVETDFIGNMAPNGAGLFSQALDAQDAGQLSVIDSSRFIGNSATAGVGGGVLFTELGLLPSISILATEFTDNSATQAGAAGAIVSFLNNTELTLESNTGGNNAGGSCDGFLTVESPTSAGPTCLGVTDNFPP
jgi:hypothetical protein